MDAHVFRFLLQEIRPRLEGRRIDRVFQPSKDLWTFRLSSREHLLLAVHPKNGVLFFSSSKPENPEQPSAQTLWWRKRIGRRRIAELINDWPERRVGLRLEPGGQWLVLDIVRGLSLPFELAEELGREPAWPDYESAVSDPEIFRAYPQMTPLLRNSLTRREPEQAAELLQSLRRGTPPGFFVCNSAYSQLVAAWHPWEQLSSEWSCQEFTTAEDAVHHYGWNLLLTRFLSPEEGKSGTSAALKKTRKRLDRVRQDEERLRGMVALYETGQLLQLNMHRLDPQGKHEFVQVMDEYGQWSRVELNPRYTVLQNMEDMFRKARKGQRGLREVQRRKQELEREWEAGGAAASGVGSFASSNPERKLAAPGESKLPPRLKKLQVAVYKSGENFTLLRGKNKKSNHKLLSQAAAPHDLWFHAEDGPGAHVILRRDFSGQEVPRKSILEAAMIAGIHSYQSMADKARVLCALVKDVRPVKGAEMGQVRVDSIRESLLVDLDSAAEESMRLQ